MLKLYLSPITRHAVLTRHALCHLLDFDKFFACVLVLSMPILNGQNSSKTPSKSLNDIKPNLIKQAGFTMLELLVVIALLGVVAIAATTFIIDTGEIQREDATRARWDEIRYAIVGNTSRGLNNSPLVSGYVADMGRLPSSLNQLMMRGTQPAWASTELSSVSTELRGTVSFGWRGPYLYSSGSAFFRDGWGNEDTTSAVNDENNSGWEVALSPVTCAPVDCAEIAVQSLGDNNQAGGTGFNADFPEDALSALVTANDWQRTANSIAFKVVFNKPPAATQSGLELRVYFFEEGTGVVDEISTVFAHDATVSGVTAHNVSIPAVPPTPILPMGKYAAAIWCSGGGVSEVVYDGDCNNTTPTVMPAYYFTLLPSTSSVDIYWNLP